jgi:butyryl-CoA dehydrogenase
MDFELSQEQRRFGDSFSEFCRERIETQAMATDLSGRVGDEVWRALADRDYLRFFHAKELGGLGLDPVCMAMAMESLGQACASTAWMATISSNLCGRVLARHGSARHRERWLEPVLKGEKLACIAIVETVGSDFSTYRTSATKTGAGYVVHGEKATVTNGPAADVCILYLLLEGGEAGSALAVVDMKQAGVTTESYDKTGLRGLPWGRIRFDGAVLAEEDILVSGPISKMMPAVLEFIEWGLLFQSCCSVGLAEAALGSTVRFHTGREAYGGPMLALQNIHGKLAEMRMQIDAGRLLTWEALGLKAAGKDTGRKCQMAKIYTSELAVQVAIDAIRLHGSAGIRKDYPVERILRDSLGSFYAGMSSDVLRDVLVAPLLDVDPFAKPSLEWLDSLGLRAERSG